jgi:hypothetical protein
MSEVCRGSVTRCTSRPDPPSPATYWQYIIRAHNTVYTTIDHLLVALQAPIARRCMACHSHWLQRYCNT